MPACPPDAPAPLAAPADIAPALAARIADAFGATTSAVIHYGSHAHGSGADSGSAWDFIVVLDDAAAGYRALARSGASRISAGLATLLHRALPPNVVAVRPPELSGNPLAKCAVVTRAELIRGCSADARDHFLLGRMFQDVRLMWTRDAGTRAEAADAIAAARAHTFAWVHTQLPVRFDAGIYLRTLLAVSYAGEVRPESGDRIGTLVAAQRDVLLPILQDLLDSLAARGRLARDGVMFRETHPPDAAERRRWRRYFLVSKIRNTLRWPKYALLYDGWLDYVLLKIERRSGERITLTPLERRWPLVFLWPRAVWWVLARPRRT